MSFLPVTCKINNIYTSDTDTQILYTLSSQNIQLSLDISVIYNNSMLYLGVTDDMNADQIKQRMINNFKELELSTFQSFATKEKSLMSATNVKNYLSNYVETINIETNF